MKEICKKYLAHVGEYTTLCPPMTADYGCFLSVGDCTFINCNFNILDSGGITIGNHVFIASNVGIYTATHPIRSIERQHGTEYKGYNISFPVVIKDEVWIGAHAIILPGVTIGERAVVAAGSVVTKDVPPDTVVAGNPARVMRKIDQKEILSEKELEELEKLANDPTKTLQKRGLAQATLDFQKGGIKR